MDTITTKEKFLRRFFDLSVVLKGIEGAVEAASGLALFFVSHATLASIVNFLTREELLEDPRDTVANFLVHSFQALPSSAQFYGALYLLVHGAIKIGLIVGLLRNRLWAYPAALIIFTGFGIYQIYYIVADHSLFMTFLTILDAIVIFLTWHEYQYRKTHRLFANAK